MTRRRLESEMVCVPIDLALRTQHVQYLEYIADRDDSNYSRALGTVIEQQISSLDNVRKPPPRKVRKHLMLIAWHLELLDQLAEKHGLTRSDAARRLIDGALMKDKAIC